MRHNINQKISPNDFGTTVENFYTIDAITRASKIMAQCSAMLLKKQPASGMILNKVAEWLSFMLPSLGCARESYGIRLSLDTSAMPYGVVHINGMLLRTSTLVFEDSSLVGSRVTQESNYSVFSEKAIPL
ncbi:hypothetical protein NL676_005527 [Syzygium grande]|nr:hypothetical protein NL676_005527 [Syzygium grande]